jgi:DNA mismatch repair protein MSH4
MSSEREAGKSTGRPYRVSARSLGSGWNLDQTSPRRRQRHSHDHTMATTVTSYTRPSTTRPSTTRPSTGRPRTGVSTLGAENQEIICAVSESRGISPTVGLAFVNLDTGEAVLSQISDSQTYIRTVHKLVVFNPSIILIVSTASSPKSKLFSIIEDSLEQINSNITTLDRRYWAENTGLDYIKQLAFAEDVDSLKTAVSGNYYAVCCFAAVLKYTELGLAKTFPLRSLRIKYEPSEGSMLIDLSTIHSLELVQNLTNPKSKDCLFGLLNETLTPMGARLLRSNILQPLTNPDTLNTRYDALEELSTKEEMFFKVRQAIKPFLDVDKTLTQLILIPIEPTLKDTKQAVNNIIMLKQFVNLVKPVFEALTDARCTMLEEIRQLCASENVEPILDLINDTINEDTTYATQPLDLRNQRTYAVKSGTNGLLDVARQTYKEAMTDALQHIADTAEEHGLPLQQKFDNTRQFFMRLPAAELQERDLPAVFINVYKKNNNVECQTMDLMKRNQKIADAHTEVLLMSDKSVQELIADLREHMSVLFKICESIAMLDMLSSFAQVVTSQDYVRPKIDEDTLAVRAGRHPIREKIQNTKFVPNDIYATQQSRFQIITGCNMSGKSTYIRTVALMSVMAQVGSFVPAQYAAFPIIRQLFARVSTDDNIEANVSTFSAEMREAAFILRNIDRHSMAIIDELGRGTSSRDGLAIAIAIAEALVESRALVWFATHFRDLANILSERNGVVNLHLAVDSSEDDKMEMMYRLTEGTVQEEHYGLKLAKVMPIPPDVIEHAQRVSETLEQRAKNKKKRSLGIINARRRKLLLNLKEHLVQAKNGNMDDATLKQWLKDLQGEFVTRMMKLDDEARKAEMGVDESDVETAQTQSYEETTEDGVRKWESTEAGEVAVKREGLE